MSAYAKTLLFKWILRMDTTEELGGTYFYHGHANVTAHELFWLIYVEGLSEHLGLDVTTTAMILGGQPWIPVSGKLSAINNTPGTSVVSKLARALLKEKRIPFGLRLSAPMGKGSKINLSQPVRWLLSLVAGLHGWVMRRSSLCLKWLIRVQGTNITSSQDLKTELHGHISNEREGFRD